MIGRLLISQMPITAGELNTHTQRRIQVGLLCVSMCVWELCKREENERERAQLFTVDRQAQKHKAQVQINNANNNTSTKYVCRCVHTYVDTYICMYVVGMCVCKYTDLTNCCAHTQKILNVYLSANNSHIQSHTHLQRIKQLHCQKEKYVYVCR